MPTPSTTREKLSAASVYTTIAPERVLEVERGDEPSEVLDEKKRWVAAQSLFEEAERRGEVFPIFLSNARNCADLVFWAHLRGIEVTASGTQFTFSHLRGIRDTTTQDLTLLKEKRNIAPDFIRPYALISTPDFLGSRSMDAYERATMSGAEVEAPALDSVEGTAATATRATYHPPRHSPRSNDKATAPLTLFSWGYYGWGSSLPQLLLATAAAERARGYEPPVFVDVRFSRSVRAAGFRDHTFEKALPDGRYTWMKGLGNEGIGTGGMKIHKPETAELLLDLAIREQAHRRRVIFFCSCQSPANCHRSRVRDLLLRAAEQRRMALHVIEWPGGEPARVHALTLEVTPALFSKILAGGIRIPIDEHLALASGVSLPWGSYVDLTDARRHVTVAVGPAQFSSGSWFMPVFLVPVDEGDEIDMLQGDVNKVRESDKYTLFSVD